MTGTAMNAGARSSLVERLFCAFSVQLSDVETRIAEKTGEGIVEDGRVLSGLAKTLETLVSVERKLIETMDGETTMDLSAMRTELAARLSKLRLGLLAEGGEEAVCAGDPA